MNTKTRSFRKVHQGRNVKRLREILVIRQELISFDLDLLQQAFSKIEQKEEIDDEFQIGLLGC